MKKNKKIHKESYRKKGVYKDGRMKIAIEQSGTTYNETLPKPEIMRQILKILKTEYPSILRRAKNMSNH